ncbi:pre-rRNA-processing protein esf1 [Irineochytrium annulatum]|nr:pre-rRNA-processing protein esf1 [Irineochytrium annulatum]
MAAPCRFYSIGTCTKGSACKFAHDRGNKDLVCSFYLQGNCKFGNYCALPHRRLKEKESASAPPIVVPPGKPFSVNRPSAPPVKSRTVPVPAPIPLDYDVFDPTLPPIDDDLARVNGPHGWPSDYAPEDLLPGPSETSPSHSEAVTLQQEYPYKPYSAVAKTNLSDSEAQSGETVYSNAPVRGAVQNRYVHGLQCPVCRKFCLHPNWAVEEVNEHVLNCSKSTAESAATTQRDSESSSMECVVCMERVYSKRDPRFGLLVWIVDPQAKAAALEAYKRRLSTIDCKHYSFGDVTCPFGSSCLYRHRLRDGTIREEARLRILQGDDEVRVMGRYWEMDGEDARFEKLKRDPRFLRPKKKETKIVIDKRFHDVFKSREFGNASKPNWTVCRGEADVFRSAAQDRYGRKTKQSKGSDLKRFYRVDDEELGDDVAPEREKRRRVDEEASDEGEGSEGDVHLSEDEEGGAGEGYRLIRGEELMESSDEEEEEEVDDVENDVDDGIWRDESETVEKGPPARRFAAVNMDWDNIKAADLWKAFEGFKPKDGHLVKVSIITSNFGKERLEKEEREGPPTEIFKAKDANGEKPLFETGDSTDFDEDALRKYQLERLKYYYAIIECDSVATAQAIVEACDNAEFERSAILFDLRYVPDDMDFENDALQHSNVKLTWDEDDPERVRMTKRKFTKQEVADMDFKSYLASDSGESDSDDDEKARRYKALLLGGAANDVDLEPKKSQGKTKGDDDDDIDMEITFTPGLSEAVEEKIAQKKVSHEETVFEAQLRKRKEKYRAKKAEKRMKDSEAEGKKKTRRELANETEKAKAELDLMMMDENNTQTRHFDMKDVLKAEKNKLKKKRKVIVANTQDGFDLDVTDSRFSEALTSHQFAIDPTNPNYKKTSAMNKLMDERRMISATAQLQQIKKAAEGQHPPVKSNPLKDLVESANKLLADELAKVATKGKVSAIDTSRFRMEPPKPSNLPEEQEKGWRDAVNNAQAQLEHQHNRLLNLELINKFGQNSWRIHNYQLEGAVNQLKLQAKQQKEELQELNKERKIDQVGVAVTYAF